MKTSRILCLAALLFAASSTRLPVADAAASLTINGFVPSLAGVSGYVPVEHTEAAVNFTLTATTSGPTTAGGYICAVQTTGDSCKHLIVPASGTFTGNIAWMAPAAIATTNLQIKFCPNDAGPTCKPSAVGTISTPVAAQYAVSIASYAIHHTRAVHDDTVAITLLGGDFRSTPACGQTPSPSCVQGALQGNHNNGTYSTTNASIGPFTIVPGTNGGLRFGYAIFNFGAGYSDSKYDQLSASLSHLLTVALTQQVALGDSALVGDPPYTDQINHLNWSGCDGPLAVDLIGIYDQTTLLARTQTTGAFTTTSSAYHFKSQTGCGSSPDYTVRYAVSRTSWRAE